MKGLFISLEGIDGAGKTLHKEWLEAAFMRHGYTVEVFREPGATPLGEQLRSLLLSEKMDPIAELLLMFAARRQLVVERIKPALQAGKVVIVDRFVDSTVAYQGGGRGISAAYIDQLKAMCLEGLMPDITLYFDVPLEVARARFLPGRALDRIEAEAESFHLNVLKAYRALAEAEPKRIRRIDSTQTIDAIQEQLGQIFADYLTSKP